MEKDISTRDSTIYMSNIALGNKLLHLRQNRLFTDCHLVCHCCPISAHKCVLSASSIFFKSAFCDGCESETAHNHSFDFSEHTRSFKQFESVINFMYTGCISINKHNFEELQYVGHYLGIQDLIDLCMEYIETAMEPKSCVEYYVNQFKKSQPEIHPDFHYKFSAPCKDDQLHDVLLRKITQHFGDLLEELLPMSAGILGHLLDKDIGSTASVKDVLDLAVRWFDQHSRNCDALIVSRLIQMGTKNIRSVNSCPCKSWLKMRCEQLLIMLNNSSEIDESILSTVKDKAHALQEDINKICLKVKETDTNIEKEESVSNNKELRSVDVDQLYEIKTPSYSKVKHNVIAVVNKDYVITSRNLAGDKWRSRNDGIVNIDKCLENDEQELQLSRDIIKKIKTGDGVNSIHEEFKIENKHEDARTRIIVDEEKQRGIVFNGERRTRNLSKEEKQTGNVIKDNKRQQSEHKIIQGKIRDQKRHLGTKEKAKRQIKDDLLFHLSKTNQINTDVDITNIVEEEGNEEKERVDVTNIDIYNSEEEKMMTATTEISNIKSNNKIKKQKQKAINTCTENSKSIESQSVLKKKSASGTENKRTGGKMRSKTRKAFKAMKINTSVVDINDKDKRTSKAIVNSMTTKNLHTNEEADTDEIIISFNKETAAVKLGQSKNEKYSSKCDNDEDEVVHKCNECQKVFKTSQKLKVHHNIHSDEKPYSCRICEKSFAVKSYLRQHEKIHSDVKPHRCSQCSYACSRKSSLKEHMLKHGEVRNFACDVCGRAFKYRDNLRLHQRLHTGEKPHQCEYCGKSFIRNRHLKVHLMRHPEYEGSAADRIQPGTTDGCDEMRTSTYMRDIPKTFVCEQCAKCYRNKTDLNNHLRLHSVHEKYTCKICDKAFCTQTSFDRHMRLHTPIPTTPYYCHQCQMMFKHKNSLTTHMRKHTGHYPFSCDTCGRKFRASTALVLHHRTHTGDKPFVCGMCHKRFAVKANLKVHLRTHTGVKPYSCSICHLTFAHGNTLQGHMRSHDNDCETVKMKPTYRCDLCDLKFTEDSIYQDHLQIHKAQSTTASIDQPITDWSKPDREKTFSNAIITEGSGEREKLLSSFHNLRYPSLNTYSNNITDSNHEKSLLSNTQQKTGELHQQGRPLHVQREGSGSNIHGLQLMNSVTDWYHNT